MNFSAASTQMRVPERPIPALQWAIKGPELSMHLKVVRKSTNCFGWSGVPWSGQAVKFKWVTCRDSPLCVNKGMVPISELKLLSNHHLEEIPKQQI